MTDGAADNGAVETEDDGIETSAERPDSEELSAATELEALRAECADSRDKLLRLAAELDNVRKRSVRELENARKYGIERLARDLLPVHDSLEAGLSVDNIDVDTLQEGQRATLRLLEQALSDSGIARIDPHGAPFDPNLHEAISLLSAPHAEPDSIIDVIQKGYAIEGRLLRPARVIVAKEPSSDDAE